MQSNDQLFWPAVLVWCKDPAQGAMLSEATVQHLGNRPFIVGTLAARDDGQDDERVGLKFWFAVDDILMLTEYPNLAMAREKYDKYKERKARQTAPGSAKRKGFFG